MKQYRELVEKILTEGVYSGDRTGTGTYSIFGHQMRFDLSEGFPLVTLKRTNFHAIKAELLWFLKGGEAGMNVSWLHEQGVRIWDEWADPWGNLGPIYGSQWRSWAWGRDGNGIDQIAQVIEQIKANPASRRLIVSAWNVGEVDQMALPPCHVLFQFYVRDGKLSCQLYQRSADVFLGLPFNIASYALLTHMIAVVTGLEVGEFIWTGGDCHLYSNHIEQARLMLERDERQLPKLTMRKALNIDDFVMGDIDTVGYDPHPFIAGEVAV